jgi:four helix bundle protein
MTNLEIQDFKDLYVWQRSMELVLDVYRITETDQRHELFNLTTQTRKSAISIPSNVAEGANRHELSVYVNHVNIAMEGELFTQLEIGRAHAKRAGCVARTRDRQAKSKKE